MTKEYVAGLEEAMAVLEDALANLSHLKGDYRVQITLRKPEPKNEIHSHAHRWGVGAGLAKKLLTAIDTYKLLEGEAPAGLVQDYLTIRSAIRNNKSLKNYSGELTRLNQAKDEHELRLAAELKR